MNLSQKKKKDLATLTWLTVIMPRPSDKKTFSQDLICIFKRIQGRKSNIKDQIKIKANHVDHLKMTRDTI